VRHVTVKRTIIEKRKEYWKRYWLKAKFYVQVRAWLIENDENLKTINV